ncbi:hypothetical protein DY000_02053938 [Brassica cretica]|uniref:Zinc knuckle CX2CX4HX4C domain-containing protein n=1 Tax=Brassica cretica TaxID=69181 RepID=A0ABQ7ABT9_BRACR|nr:hypothetical protein DY000_02053938 [Brassica cretica]
MEVVVNRVIAVVVQGVAVAGCKERGVAVQGVAAASVKKLRQQRIHGIPLHFWSEQTIRTIGKELGNYSLRDEKDAKIWVEVNGLQPLIMKMEIELPTDDITEVEFEYMKIEKHCFTCFSLLHEEIDCPYRPLNAPPPKERKLGITQSIALQRIEAEKKRHDDRRGYSRPENANLSLRSADDSYIQPRREDGTDGRSHKEDFILLFETEPIDEARDSPDEVRDSPGRNTSNNYFDGVLP